ncbi:hypothetical protein L2E82_43050 [Cichorium intybus]|uniref:Uncharacterized protein n=1 Tax=Cichorium intybus TaxID=13427 RepID=A0ACB8ZN80_CICIN|nr:hypothetical protein L2E82_43050 [Cichorium intybus]
MYVNNIVLAQEVYFDTVIYSSPEFKNTTINTDLRYMTWDKPQKMDPIFLNKSNYKDMVESGAAFARRFEENNAFLDMIDGNILKRRGGGGTGGMVPGHGYVMKSKQPSRYQKLKKRKLEEKKRKADFGALHNFIVKQPVDEHVDEHVEENIEEHVEEHVEEQEDVDVDVE